MKYEKFLLTGYMYISLYGNEPHTAFDSYSELHFKNPHAKDNNPKDYCVAATAGCLYIISHTLCPWNPCNACISLTYIAACQTKNNTISTIIQQPSSILLKKELQ